MAAAPGLQVSSRMLKAGARNRPFAQDLHDLFATLIVSLRLDTHRSLFKSYLYTFTTDEAVANLSALKFSQSSRQPDPNEPSRVITTTTTTTFTMNRQIAKNICQHFLDCRLLFCANDCHARTFRDKGIWGLTPKGLCLLEQFVSVNGISADHLQPALAAHRPHIRLVYLERRESDDEISMRLVVLDSLFRHFAGRAPNYVRKEAQHGTLHYRSDLGFSAILSDSLTSTYGTGPTFDRAQGIELADVTEREETIKHVFSAFSAIDWLVDYTTVCAPDEAAELLAHFERLDLIKSVSDKLRVRPKPDQPPDADLVVVRGPDVGGMITEGVFRCHSLSAYALTERGRQVAGWVASPDRRSTSTSQPTTSLRQQSPADDTRTPSNHNDAQSVRSSSSRDPRSDIPRSETSFQLGRNYRPGSGSGNRDQGTCARLRHILSDTTLCQLFQSYLRRNYCVENLSFYLDVEDFKRRFNTTSSASAVYEAVPLRQQDKPRKFKSSWLPKLGNDPSDSDSRSKSAAAEEPEQKMSAMERHHRDLIVIAFLILSTYLVPGAPAELNLEHGPRTELLAYMQKIAPQALDAAFKDQASSTAFAPIEENASQVPDLSLEERKKRILKRLGPAAQVVHASQLQALLRLYSKIQEHIWHLMATDSLPRFVRDPAFVEATQQLERLAGSPPEVLDWIQVNRVTSLPAV